MSVKIEIFVNLLQIKSKNLKRFYTKKISLLVQNFELSMFFFHKVLKN